MTLSNKRPEDQTTEEWLAHWQARDDEIRANESRDSGEDMKIKKDEGGGSVEFNITPSGTHIARCVRVIDMGTQKTTWQGNEKLQAKIFVLYELPNAMNKFTDSEGNEKILPFAAVKSYTNSLYEKSALYQHLHSWLGSEFVDDPESFDFSQIIGKPCMISVVHDTGNDGKTYASISSVSAMPEGMECPKQINPSIMFDINDFDQKVFDDMSENMQNKIKSSPEYQQRGMNGNYQPPQSENPGSETQKPADSGFDDIPF